MDKNNMVRKAALKATKPAGKAPQMNRKTAKSVTNILGSLKRRSAKKTEIGF